MTQSAGRLDTPIVCDLSTIPSDQRESHIAVARSLFAAEHAVVRHSDGLEVSLPADRLSDVVSFIENERRCCRHLAFGLDIPPSDAPLTLRVIGPGAFDELQTLMR